MNKKILFIPVIIVAICSAYFIYYKTPFFQSVNNKTLNITENTKYSDTDDNSSIAVNDESDKSSDKTSSYVSSTTSGLKRNIITVQEFLNNQQCSTYIIKSGETLTNIAKHYEDTCTLNSTIKLIKSLSKITNPDNISVGLTLNIPETTLKNGSIYTVQSGDTWSKIRDLYYPIYDENCIMNLIVYVNDLPNNDLPLNTALFLPKI